VLLCVSCVVSPCEFLRRDFYDNDLRQFTERENNRAEKFCFAFKTKEPGVSMFPPIGFVFRRQIATFYFFVFPSPPKKIIRQLSKVGLLWALRFGRVPSRTLFPNINAISKTTDGFQAIGTIQIRIIITALPASCKVFHPF
jgi:hypothetical protein